MTSDVVSRPLALPVRGAALTKQSPSRAHVVRILVSEYPMPMSRGPKSEVYTLVVQVGRKEGDGLPDGSTGAGLLCYASGRDEAEAVRETVQTLKQADLAPLDVTAYGTEAERAKEGHDIDPAEAELMARALADDAVIVAEVTPFFE